MTEERLAHLRQVLSELSPKSLEIRDDSALHAGHSGHRGGSHFAITIVSEAFEGLSLVQRHRLVYQTVDSMLQNNEIHALSITAKTPAEVNAS